MRGRKTSCLVFCEQVQAALTRCRRTARNHRPALCNIRGYAHNSRGDDTCRSICGAQANNSCATTFPRPSAPPASAGRPTILQFTIP
ncbi:hypothetical protein K1T71_003190 [Dendrolimus kikuchii]|uniref:Uncharacterized protein n=1 Tax=Dendrolimus kikuchii TaxID=765133 RepID=A0ACC1DB94_9NEOP|nr:hypothetical protein K1T71_003190 [Dendrolimus kikuchii]